MRRVSKQEWENEHMHNPMTEGEALAEWVAAGGSHHGPNVETVTMPLADYVRFRAALTAHTAASGGEVAVFDRDRTVKAANFRAVCYALQEVVEGVSSVRWVSPGGMRFKDTQQWVQFYVAVNEMRRLLGPDPYTTPPAAVPADALERLVAQWRDEVGTPTTWVGESVHECADELAALIPKGADHEQR